MRKLLSLFALILVPLVASAQTVTLTGPTSGSTGFASTNFTVTPASLNVPVSLVTGKDSLVDTVGTLLSAHSPSGSGAAGGSWEDAYIYYSMSPNTSIPLTALSGGGFQASSSASAGLWLQPAATLTDAGSGIYVQDTVNFTLGAYGGIGMMADGVGEPSAGGAPIGYFLFYQPLTTKGWFLQKYWINGTATGVYDSSTGNTTNNTGITTPTPSTGTNHLLRIERTVSGSTATVKGYVDGTLVATMVDTGALGAGAAFVGTAHAMIHSYVPSGETITFFNIQSGALSPDVVTPASNNGGTFSPTSLSFSTANPSPGTFTYTPSADGAHSISITDSSGATVSGSPIVYTSTSAGPTPTPTPTPTATPTPTVTPTPTITPTPTPTPMGQTVYMDSTLIVKSPTNWKSYTSGGHPAIGAVYAGSYIRAKFNGTSLTIGVDTSTLTNYSFTFFEVDANEPVIAQMTSGQTAISVTGLAAGDHEMQLTLFARNQADATWDGSQALNITSLTPAGGSGMEQEVARPKKLIAFGDSITEGLAQGPTTDPHYAVTNSGFTGVNSTASANYGYANLLGHLLNAEFDQAGFGGTDWAAGYGIDAPSLEAAYAFNQSGSGRNTGIANSMDYVTINMGTNGTPNVSDVTRILGEIRTFFPNSIIFVLCTFNHNTAENAANQAGLAAYLSGHPSETKMFYIDPGVLAGNAGPAVWWTSLDIHPSPMGHGRLAASYGAEILKHIGTSAAVTRGFSN